MVHQLLVPGRAVGYLYVLRTEYLFSLLPPPAPPAPNFFHCCFDRLFFLKQTALAFVFPALSAMQEKGCIPRYVQSTELPYNNASRKKPGMTSSRSAAATSSATDQGTITGINLPPVFIPSTNRRNFIWYHCIRRSQPVVVSARARDTTPTSSLEQWNGMQCTIGLRNQFNLI